MCFVSRKYKELNYSRSLCRSHSFYKQFKTQVSPPNANYSKYFSLFLLLIISSVSHCVETSLPGLGRDRVAFRRGALVGSCHQPNGQQMAVQTRALIFAQKKQALRICWEKLTFSSLVGPMVLSAHSSFRFSD